MRRWFLHFRVLVTFWRGCEAGGGASSHVLESGLKKFFFRKDLPETQNGNVATSVKKIVPSTRIFSLRIEFTVILYESNRSVLDCPL